MATITNHSEIIPMKLPSGHVIPKNGSLETTNDVINDNSRYLSGLVSSGRLSILLDPEPEPEVSVPLAQAPEPELQAKLDLKDPIKSTTVKGA